MELDSGADSVSSTPRAAHHRLIEDHNKSVVRLMCSFGGKILPRPHDNQLRYVGGDTRIIVINRATSYSSLVAKLPKQIGSVQGLGEFCIKYQLPNEDLDALITISTDEDVENMMEEFERLTVQQISSSSSSNNNNNNNNPRVPRLRLFLFPPSGVDDDTSRTSSIASLLDGSRKRESWFFDALNGGGVNRAPLLERGRSEASSIVSEVPDYLFGLDNSDDQPVKFRNRAGLGDGMPGSGPGSPAFGSTSSAAPMPNLPPVKTKPENPDPVQEMSDTEAQLVGGYGGVVGVGQQVWGHNSNPSSPYPIHGGQAAMPMQHLPVYYVPAAPGQGLVPHINPHMQPVQVPVPAPGHYVQQYAPGQAQMPVGYPGSGPVYAAGAVRTTGGNDPYEMQRQGNLVQVHGSSGLSLPVYYGIKNAGPGMVASYPGMVVPGPGDEIVGSAFDASKGRTQHP